MVSTYRNVILLVSAGSKTKVMKPNDKIIFLNN